VSIDQPTDPAVGPEAGEPAPAPHHHRDSTTRTIIEWVVIIVGAVALALVIKAFLLQAFFIPSKSMDPTLAVGDRVLVNKLSYHLHDVNRGDIVVFERLGSTHDDGINDLIKRVVALPGETLVIKDNKVYIDGEELAEPYLQPGTPTTNGPLPPYTCTVDSPCTVPEHAVWVMGDNRTDSQDSRYWGPVPEDKVVGRAFFRVWPLNRIGFL